MSSFITPLSFVVFGILFLFFSKSKKQYREMVENVGEESAKKRKKLITICGYGLLLCAGVLILIALQSGGPPHKTGD